ncbi:RimK-like ATPgrasp N-terminal domain-containing protein [Inquilinus sp.]|uniref:RimK-like ATPgrasp N-terminal domain-containing protein n=1 Tax=Inquilinus sp. TaxID=1932117 RepID=UPI0031E18D06
MATTLIVADDPDGLAPDGLDSDLPPPCRIVAPDDLLDGRHLPAPGTTPGTIVVNLCRDQRPLSFGYYVSLIAEARGYTAIPTAAALADQADDRLARSRHAPVDRALAALRRQSQRLVLPRRLFVALGRCSKPHLQAVAEAAYEAFGLPLMTLQIDPLRPQLLQAVAEPLAGLDPRQLRLLRAALERLAGTPPTPRPFRRAPRLAVLVNPDDPLPPSKPGTIARLRDVASSMGVDTECVGHRDLPRLGGFDALLIRETTALQSPSYAFAETAAQLGLPVIDDPVSILRCCNKVFLHERLKAEGVPQPRTLAVRADTLAAGEALGFPLVLKVPDGACSRGVIRVDSPGELPVAGRRLLRRSRLILAQEYLYTDFDWRIGVLAGRPLFACRYRMVRGHWQIFRHDGNGSSEEGATEPVPLDAVPPAVLSAALSAAALIGTGLYGVDLKETAQGPVVIEVNDNPNIDVGLEDACLGDALYERLLGHFLERIETGEDRAPARAAGSIW